MSFTRSILPLAAAACLMTLGSCSAKKVERAFPVGDQPSDERESLRTQVAETPIVDPTPRRRFVDVPANRNEFRGLRLSIDIIDPEVQAGEEALFSITIRNNTSIPETIPYTTEQRFDLVAFLDETRQEPVFVWSETQRFADIFREYTLSPRGTLNRILDIPTQAIEPGAFREPTDLRSPLGPGRYYVYALHSGFPFLAAGPVILDVLP